MGGEPHASRTGNAASRPPRPDALLDDPTELKGQDSKRLARGRTHGLSYSLNARDGFIPTRAQCRVITDHLDIDPEEDVTVGELRKGRIRVSVAVPADAELTSKSFTLRVEEWLTMQGGLHVPLEATTQIEIVDEDGGGKPQPPKPPRDRRKPAPAPLATVWTTHELEAGVGGEHSWGCGKSAGFDVCRGGGRIQGLSQMPKGMAFSSN